MKIINLFNNLQNIEEVTAEAKEVLSLGGTIVYPTDTFYGLGANALNESAIKQIFKIKKRDPQKPLPIIIKNIGWADELAYLNKDIKKTLSVIWPGPVTAVLPKKPVVPQCLVSGNFNVGLRIPNYSFTDRLLGKFGYPITSTSANLAGRPATGKIKEIIATFQEEFFKPDLVINAGDLAVSEPSTIIDLSSSKPKILRVGMTKPAELLRLLEI